MFLVFITGGVEERLSFSLNIRETELSQDFNHCCFALIVSRFKSWRLRHHRLELAVLKVSQQKIHVRRL